MLKIFVTIFVIVVANIIIVAIIIVIIIVIIIAVSIGILCSENGGRRLAFAPAPTAPSESDFENYRNQDESDDETGDTSDILNDRMFCPSSLRLHQPICKEDHEEKVAYLMLPYNF